MALTETRLDKIIGIGSGTGSRPAFGQNGARWIDTSTAPATETADTGTAWVAVGAAGGGGGGASHALATVTIVGTTTTIISFTAISGAYRNLQLIGNVATNTANSADRFLQIQANSDTTAGHYKYGGSYITSGASGFSAGSASAVGLVVGEIDQASAAAANLSGICIDIPNYANTVPNKTMLARTASALGSSYQYGGVWISTAAITRLDFTTTTTVALVAGSTLTLYGID